jgi:HEPN domain-containing protein
MALPQRTEARPYYRAAKQRYDDALLLLHAERTTGAVYLAGYTVECYLKALILSGVAPKRGKRILEMFRGRLGHDIAWLVELYRSQGSKILPRDVMRHLSRLASWTTDLRYETGTLKKRDANGFLESVRAVASWAEERM